MGSVQTHGSVHYTGCDTENEFEPEHLLHSGGIFCSIVLGHKNAA